MPADSKRFELTLTPGKGTKQYAFGCKQEDMISTLEDLLARLKDKRLMSQELSLAHNISFDSYAIKTVTFKVAEAVDPVAEEPVKAT